MPPIDSNASHHDLTTRPAGNVWFRKFPVYRICKVVLMLLSLATAPGCKPAKMQALLEPSQALGTVLAEETTHLAGANKLVVLIVPGGPDTRESTVEESFRGILKKLSIEVATVKTDVGDPMFMSRGFGLAAADFFGAMDKSPGAGAVISLAGAPLLKPGDEARLGADHPPVLVVATGMLGNRIGVRSDPTLLARLLQSKVIQLAIVDGANPAVQAAGKKDATHESFQQNYQILRPTD